jgi:hypothetical protein
MSIVAERAGMHDSLSGATTNLLRMARSECRGALAFVALSLDDNLFATASYPTVSDDDLFGEEEVEEVVHQAWADPEFGQASVFVRASRLKSRRLARPKRFVVAIVPLGDGPGGRPWGMLGVVDPESGGFEPPQLDLLDQIAQRLASHLRARQEVRATVAASTAARTAASNGPAAPISWPADDPTPVGAAGPVGVPAPVGAVRTDDPGHRDPSHNDPSHNDPGGEDPGGEDPGGEDEPWWSVEPGHVPAHPAEGAELAADRPEPAADRPEPSLPTPPEPEPAFSRADPSVDVRGPSVIRPGPPLWAAATQLGQLGVRRPPGADPSRAVLAGFVRNDPRPDDDWAPVDEPAAAQPTAAQPAAVQANVVRSQPVQPEPDVRFVRSEAERRVQPEPDIRFVEPTQSPSAQFPSAGADLLPTFLSASSTPGLVGLAAFVGRAGRMLGAGAVAGGGPLAVVVLEIVGPGPLDEPAVTEATAAIRRELRFDDPVAQLGPTVFAAAVPLVPGGSDGPAVESRLAAALRSTSGDPQSRVRAAHVVAAPTERADADELLRSAMAMLREG